MLLQYLEERKRNEQDPESIRKLDRWHAQYLESKQDIEGAIRCYTKAQDWNSLVRLFCYSGDLGKAKQICTDTKDKGACYHVAGVLEQRVGNVGAETADVEGWGAQGNLGSTEDQAMLKEV